MLATVHDSLPDWLTQSLEIVHFCQESTVDREGLQSRLGVKMAVKGATPYELGHGKSYKGLLAEYGEPVHAYTKSLNKGEGQDTYVLTDGVQVALSKGIRRTDQILGIYKKPHCLLMGVPDKPWR